MKPEKHEEYSGVTAIIGFILLLGILSMFLVTVQTQAVPKWNSETESQHAAKIQQDMQDLTAGITSTAGTAESRMVSLKLGTNYNTLPLLSYPPDPIGELYTGNTETTKIENMTATDPEVNDFYDGRDYTFETKNLTYSPRYNRLGNAGKLVIENGQLYHSVNGNTAALSENQLIDGNKITLTPLTGNLSMSSMTAGVTISPESAPYQTVTVNASKNKNIVLEIPSSLDQRSWNKILKPETINNGGHIKRYTVHDGKIRITLENNQVYELKTAKVGLGGDPESKTNQATRETQDKNRYIIPNTETTQVVQAGEKIELETKIRTKFNTPISGEKIEWRIKNGKGNLTPNNKQTTSKTSNEKGVSTVIYNPPKQVSFNQDETAKIQVKIGSESFSNTPEYKKTSFDIEILGNERPGPKPDRRKPLVVNPSSEGDVINSNNFPVGCYSRSDGCIAIVLSNLGEKTKTLEKLKVNYVGESGIDRYSRRLDIMFTEPGFKPGKKVERRIPSSLKEVEPEIKIRPWNQDPSNSLGMEFLLNHTDDRIKLPREGNSRFEVTAVWSGSDHRSQYTFDVTQWAMKEFDLPRG